MRAGAHGLQIGKHRRAHNDRHCGLLRSRDVLQGLTDHTHHAVGSPDPTLSRVARCPQKAHPTSRSLSDQSAIHYREASMMTCIRPRVSMRPSALPHQRPATCIGHVSLSASAPAASRTRSYWRSSQRFRTSGQPRALLLALITSPSLRPDCATSIGHVSLPGPAHASTCDNPHTPRRG